MPWEAGKPNSTWKKHHPYNIKSVMKCHPDFSRFSTFATIPDIAKLLPTSVNTGECHGRLENLVPPGKTLHPYYIVTIIRCHPDFNRLSTFSTIPDIAKVLST
jgi:hypothetical protein